MMKTRFRFLTLLVLVLSVAWPLGMSAAAQAQDPAQRWRVSPTTNNGQKWRIGYYEGGQYPDYEVILKATVRGLISLGWMQPLEIPEGAAVAPGGFWRYLAENTVSDYIRFVPDAYYNAGNFDRDQRGPARAAVLERLADKKDVDLMIAMGTWAGQDLATDAHGVPTVVMSTSDPVAAGIVVSAEDSGLPHLHAKVEPQRYARQVELFHDILGFKSLGLVYEDSEEGRTFAAVADVEDVAKARGFKIERCLAPFSGVDDRVAETRAAACYASLADKVDAVYLTVHRGLNENSFPGIIEGLNRASVPTFSMLGENEVKQGALMSVAQSNYVYVGQFHAKTIAEILNGAAPGDLPQVWRAPAKIALNLKTAEVIGYDPTVDILMASDEIYQTIETPGEPVDSE